MNRLMMFRRKQTSCQREFRISENEGVKLRTDHSHWKSKRRPLLWETAYNHDAGEASVVAESRPLLIREVHTVNWWEHLENKALILSGRQGPQGPFYDQHSMSNIHSTSSETKKKVWSFGAHFNICPRRALLAETSPQWNEVSSTSPKCCKAMPLAWKSGSLVAHPRRRSSCTSLK
jgi:hypothetical protein